MSNTESFMLTSKHGGINVLINFICQKNAHGASEMWFIVNEKYIQILHLKSILSVQMWILQIHIIEEWSMNIQRIQCFAVNGEHSPVQTANSYSVPQKLRDLQLFYMYDLTINTFYT